MHWIRSQNVPAWHPPSSASAGTCWLAGWAREQPLHFLRVCSHLILTTRLKNKHSYAPPPLFFNKKPVSGSCTLRLREMSYSRQQSYFIGGSTLAEAETVASGTLKKQVCTRSIHRTDDAGDD